MGRIPGGIPSIGMSGHVCILCGAAGPERLVRVASDDIKAQWRDALGLDVAAEFGPVPALDFYRCRACKLGYFEPPVVGSSAFYAQLERFDWYYLQDKWDYGHASRWLTAGVRLLEVGCGRGHFLRQAQRERGASVVGLELNESAVATATVEGLDVYLQPVERYAEDHAEAFDVVCGFQVLEHVPYPRPFLDACLRLLRPGGRLMLTVPNHDSFIRLTPDSIWNRPPHHGTQWSLQTLAYLPRLFPVCIEAVQCEPLAEVHLDWYLNAHLDRIPDIRFVKGLSLFLARRLLRPLLRWTPARLGIRGHSVFVSLLKSHSGGSAYAQSQ